jgi:hypothetical protein
MRAGGGHAETTQGIAYPHDLVRAQASALRSHAEIAAFTSGPVDTRLSLASCRTLAHNMSHLVSEMQRGSVPVRPLHFEVSAVVVGSCSADALAVLNRVVATADTALLPGGGEGQPSQVKPARPLA